MLSLPALVTLGELLHQHSNATNKLNPVRFRVFLAIACTPEVTARQIKDMLGMPEGTVNRQLQALRTMKIEKPRTKIGLGLIEAHVFQGDLSQHTYALTPRGKEFLRKLLALGEGKEKMKEEEGGKQK